jgi:hypothetical protein
MSVIRNRNLLGGQPGPTPSSGNGGDCAYDYEGQRNPDYRAPQPSAPISSANADENSGTARGHALTQAYTVGRAKYNGVDFDASQTGAGISVGGTREPFGTRPSPGADNDPCTTVGGTDPLTLRGESDGTTDDSGSGMALL